MTRTLAKRKKKTKKVAEVATPGVAADPRWIRARRELLERVKGEVFRRLGPEPADVAVFTRRYEKELSVHWEPATKSELLSAIEQSDIVYGGDFHAFGQAQRTHLKILRAVPHDGRPVCLALECLPLKSQKHVEAFLRGEIDAQKFKDRVNWIEEWGFPFENYLPLFELAKARKFSIIALNSATHAKRSGAQLSMRERTAAKAIQKVLRTSPGVLVYVIFGDLHLAHTHLPKAVRESLPASAEKNLRDLVVHLNSERLYFQLARKGLELSVDVVRMKKSGDYCVLSSPPWVKWQSYLMFLDRNVDVDLDEDDDELGFDPTDQVAALVRLAAQDLGVDVRLDRLAVYAEDDERIWSTVGRALGAKDQQIAKALLSDGRSFFLPRSGVAYLSRLTVNHAASAAGHYLHAELSKRTRTLWKMPSDFRAAIWTEASAYFISKLINHKRQTETLIDLRTQLAMDSSAQDHDGSVAMKLALDVAMSEILWVQSKRRRPIKVRPRRTSSYLEASRILGGLMGERLYLAFRSRKLIESEVVSWLRRDVEAKGFSGHYEHILERLQEALSEDGLQARVKLKNKSDRL